MRPTVRKVTRYLYYHPTIFAGDTAYHLASLQHAPEMSEVIWEVKAALKKGISPLKCENGTGSTYILRGEDERPLAIFKLEYFLKEYAAYRLDHRRFAGVPPTVVATLTHPLLGENVTGSCQLFIEGSVTVIEISNDKFAQFSPSCIRRISQLDIRLINEDRHSSNLLVCNEDEVIPIDHGFALRSDLGRVHFTWVDWIQAATPFSEEEQNYISWLDPEKDRHFLMEDLRLPEKVANRLYLSTMLLKIGTIYGFYPNQLGDIFMKHCSREPDFSKFEILINRILEREAKDWTTFTKYVNEEIKVILEEYAADQQTHFSISN